MKNKYHILDEKKILQFVLKHKVAIIVICALYGFWLYKGYYICTSDRIRFDLGYKFSKEKWGKMEDQGEFTDENNLKIGDLRRAMLCDLVSNYIYRGMSKDEVIEILGNDFSQNGYNCYNAVPIWGNLTNHNYTYKDLQELHRHTYSTEKSSKVPKISNYLKYFVAETIDGGSSILFIFDSNNVIVDYVYSYSI
ncbi:MAG: hypothetical protein J0M05_03650 [Candidatus Kapabacteria bacterium]|nr:hypothetical protein [Candidatus Kapabacteria bacterium]